MRAPRKGFLIAVAAVMAVATGCSDDPTSILPPGAIEIQVLASGPDAIMTNVRVAVANGPVIPVDSAQRTIVISDLPPGSYSLQLEGLSGNCQVTSTNPRQVAVVSNRITVITFTVACTRRVGTVRVITSTTGTDLDPDGYTVVVEAASHPIGANDTTAIVGVGEGSRPVTLNGVAPNCTVAGGTTFTSTVAYGATSDVTFIVGCVAFGAVEVTVTTTGVDLDANGYTVNLYAASVGFTQEETVDLNESVVFDRLRPADDYHLTINGMNANCFVAGGPIQVLEVNPGETTDAVFAVSCEPVRHLAFTRSEDIYVIASNGTGLTRLTESPGFDGEPAWSSGGQIAFVTRRHSGDAELYVMNADGSNATRLTTSAGDDDAPSWSPDGQQIVFRSGRDVNSEIYLINANGSGLRRLTTNDASDYEPAWSATGKIAFISTRDHALGEIYVMNTDGSNVVRLTNNAEPETMPAWSPDGSMIAFTRQVFCYYVCTFDVFVMNADGTGERRLATAWDAHSHHSDPAWSPNGRSLSFTREFCGYYYYYCGLPSVWVVDVQGAQPRELLTNGSDAVWKP